MSRCRLCLAEGATGCIFGGEVSLAPRIRACCRLRVNKNDGLPNSICFRCIITLEKLSSFINICRESDRILRGNLKPDFPISEHIEILKKDENATEYVETPVNEFKFSQNERIFSDTNPLCETPIKIELQNGDVKLENDNFYPIHIKHEMLETIIETDTCPDSIVNINNNETVPKIEQENEKKDLRLIKKKARIRKPRNSISLRPTGAKSLLCPICGEVFKSHVYLGRHIKTHNPIKRFACEICEKKFSSNSKRKEHEGTHITTKNFTCERCDKKFSSIGTMRKHVKIVHLKLRRTQCKLCEKYYSTSCSFQKHMLTHTGQRDFECDVCHKRFAYKSSIQCHMRTHSGDKPYACKFCSSRFAHSRSLVDHERLHTGETPFKCPICAKGFAQRGNMKSHFANNHKECGPYNVFILKAKNC